MKDKQHLTLVSDAARALGPTGGAILTVGALAVGGICLGARAFHQMKIKQEQEDAKALMGGLGEGIGLVASFFGGDE